MHKEIRQGSCRHFVRAAEQIPGNVQVHPQDAKKVIYKTLLILMATISIVFDAASTHSEASAIATDSAALELPTVDMDRLVGHDEILDKIDMLLLHKVSRGQLQHMVLTGEDLMTAGSVEIDGYVSGIVVFCDEEMTVYAANQKMERIRKNPDGTLSLQYDGNLVPGELPAEGAGGACLDAKHRAPGKVDRSRACLPACGYSLFPPIKGNSVSTNDQFVLSFEWQGRSFQIPVRQNGICSLGAPCASAGHPEGVSFRYIGNRLAQLTKQSLNLEKRIHAIMKGAGFVETAFQTLLIDRVTILDYEGIRNAVMSEGDDGIWVYIRTLREEPLAELETIAEHETLHKYVSAKRLAKDTGVRRLFADLKGYDALSPERFLLMMGGDSIQKSPRQESAQSLFFAFINERNFLAEKKGGHSHENVAEFCTSFLHSLMYLDRLDQNLDRPVKLSAGARQAHLLTLREKKIILDNYLKTIRVLLRSFVKKGHRAPELLTESLLRVQHLQERCAPATRMTNL